MGDWYEGNRDPIQPRLSVMPARIGDLTVPIEVVCREGINLIITAPHLIKKHATPPMIQL